MSYGVTEAMIASYAPAIFELGLNIQRRRGDAVRELDFARIEAQRDGTGRSDAEIAARLGLHVQQVTFIRVIAERRVFRRNQHAKLFPLGAGKRYRAADFIDQRARLALGAEALQVRESLAFAADQVSRFVSAGWWGAETLDGLLAVRAQAAPSVPAVSADGATLTWDELAQRVAARAGDLAVRGLARGEVAAFDGASGVAGLIDLLATARLGAIALPLPRALGGRRRAACLAHARVRFDLAADAEMALAAQGKAGHTAGSVAADPVLLCLAGDAAAPRLAIHTHQTLLAAARGLRTALRGDGLREIAASGDLSSPTAWLALGSALLDGATWRFADAAQQRLDCSAVDGSTSVVRWAASADEFRAEAASVLRLWGRVEAPAAALGDTPVALPGMQLRGTRDLEVRGACLFGGYLGDPMATQAALGDDGWLRLAG